MSWRTGELKPGNLCWKWSGTHNSKYHLLSEQITKCNKTWQVWFFSSSVIHHQQEEWQCWSGASSVWSSSQAQDAIWTCSCQHQRWRSCWGWRRNCSMFVMEHSTSTPWASWFLCQAMSTLSSSPGTHLTSSTTPYQHHPPVLSFFPTLPSTSHHQDQFLRSRRSGACLSSVQDWSRGRWWSPSLSTSLTRTMSPASSSRGRRRVTCTPWQIIKTTVQ